MQIISNIDQGGDAWFKLRFGFITASRFKDVLAGGAGKTRKSYMLNLAAEIITGAPCEAINNKYIEWGTETEPQARATYELMECCDVEQIAFAHFDDRKIGCSPDGLVGKDGLVEFKCPSTTTQIETYLSGKMPSAHKPQVQGQMWVMGREWCDFVSFDPRINAASSYFKIRVYRDDDYIANLSDKCDVFLSDLEELIVKIT